MNNTSFDSVVTTMTQYACFGSATILSNCIILFILFHDIKLFKKSAFIFGLAIGDLLDGLGLLITGVVRVQYALAGSYGGLVNPSYCMKTMITPIFLLGNQIPGAMFFLVGLERLTAVQFFEWYYTGWSYKLSWCLTGAVYLLCFISLSVAFAITFTSMSDEIITSYCTTPQVVGSVYNSYNYGVSIVGGIVASVATLAAMIIFTMKKRKLLSALNVSTNIKCHVKDQWSVSRLMLCLSVMDLGLVVIPNIVVINIKVGSIQAIALELVCLRSMLNLVVYLLANSEFRSSLARKLCSKNVNSVEPIFDQKCQRFSVKKENYF